VREERELKALLASVVTAAMVGGVAWARPVASGGHVFYAHSGDSIVIANTQLRCYVAPSQVGCGRSGGSLPSFSAPSIGADVRSDGSIAIVGSDTPHSAFALLLIKRAVCSASTGSCHLVTSP
jgi:hypothetical protein